MRRHVGMNRRTEWIAVAGYGVSASATWRPNAATLCRNIKRYALKLLRIAAFYASAAAHYPTPFKFGLNTVVEAAPTCAYSP